jgi:sugar/nucleoside kinase (ribokinase family)
LSPAFKYLTPKIRLDQNSLPEHFLLSNSFHLVCSAERCIALVNGILERRAIYQDRQGVNCSRPYFVWEPVPDLCIPEEVDKFKVALREVDVLSPNAEELAGFFKGQTKSQDDMATEILQWGIGRNSSGALVVREGKLGCSAFSNSQYVHLRAYHTQDKEMESRVKDPTGGGNAFLGALAMALSGAVFPELGEADELRGVAGEELPILHLLRPLIYAIVAASFVIEQSGMPRYGVLNEKCETWNDESFADRFREYTEREKAYIESQLKN